MKEQVLTAAENMQYFTFILGDEVFSMELQNVREVLDYTSITRIPRMPDFMLGVINLRGNVVPVVNLRLKLGMEAGERTVNTCIVIVELEIEGELTQIGAVADAVKEVLYLERSNISPPPRIGTNLKTGFLKGMGKKDDEFIMILDIGKVFADEELSAVREMGGQAAAE